MTHLFKKAVFFTDLHTGLKGNSELHNQDCINFITWMCKTAKEQGCETCFFLGDFHNNRASINLKTLHYSVRCLEIISEHFDHAYILSGNHDNFYRDKREVQSISWANHIPNITIINDFFQAGDVSIVPWLVGDDYKKVNKINAKYMFGHFELPNFYMNSLVKMPDHGDLKADNFGHVDHVFSGHFHKRQHNKNVTYIGNAFPHNFADAGDDDRGIMILEWGGTPQFMSWPGQPTFRVYNLSDVLGSPETMFKPDMYARINIDVDLSYEEATFIRETFLHDYGLREITLIPAKTHNVNGEVSSGDISFESVDSIVTNQITAITSDHYDPNLLLDIYRYL
jgi:hypothetical protein